MQTEKNIWLKVLSMFLILAMLISCVPNQVYAMAGQALENLLEQEEAAEESISTPNETKRDVYEVTDRREANVKHFALEDGTYMAVMYGSAVHTMDADGNWQDIDNRLSDSGSEFSTSNARIKFAKKITGNENLFTLHDGNRKITMSLNNAIKKTTGAVTNHTTEFDSDATQLQKLMTLDNLSSEILYADILDGVDLQYVVESLNVKENIIVKQRKDSYQYTFTIALNNLEAEMAEDGSVRIYDPGTKETVYNIPAGFMYDANGEYSTAVVYALADGGNGKYTLTVTADATWINAAERAFPVVIDPTISTDYNASAYDATFISLSNVNINNSSLGYFDAGTKAITFWKMHTLPTLPAGYYITDASFVADRHGTNSATYDLELGIYKVISDWDIDTFNYLKYENQDIGECAEYAIDAQSGTNQNAQYVWDITQMVREWYNDPSSNYGLAIRNTTTSTSDYYYRFTLNGSALPLRITYKSMRGLEDYWSYATQNVGRAGTGYVNKATGELNFTIGTLSTTDGLFGHTTALVYNQAFAGQYFINDNAKTPLVARTTGYGMKMNVNESLVFDSYINEEDDSCTYYIWIDADGTEHEFYPTSESTNTYEDSDGLQLILTQNGSAYEIADRNHNVRTFTEIDVDDNGSVDGAILTSITDKNGNKLVYDYMEDGKIERVQVLPRSSTVISYYKFHYNDDGQIALIDYDTNVSEKTTPAVKFYYSPDYSNTTNISQGYQGYLKKIEFINKQQVVATVSYEYDSSGKLIAAHDDTSGYSVRYTYSGNRVSSVAEYAGANDTQGQTITLSYGDGYTEIRTSGSDDQHGTNDDIITVYIFDSFGRVISTYSTDAARTTIYGASSGEYETQENVKNNLKTTMTIGGSASNYIVNGGFEKITSGSAENWYKTGNVSFGLVSPAVKVYDNYCAQFALFRNNTGELAQRVFLPAGSYTLSLDFNTNNAYDIDASVTAKSVNNTDRSFFTKIPTDEGNVIPEWTNLALTFEVQNYNSTGGEVFEISIVIDCSSYPTGKTGEILIDNVMLEKSIGQSGYSMVEFGNFEDYSVAWNNISKQSYSSYWLTPFSVVYENTLLGKVLKVDPSAVYTSVAAVQTIYESVDGRVDELPKSFIVSGMAKGTQQYASGDFCVQLYIVYADGERQTVALDFQNDCTTWQFASKAFTTQEKAIDRIDLEIVYNNPGIAYFDNIYVTQVMADLVTNTTYNEEGQLIERSDGINQDMYGYDANENLTLHLHNDRELYLYTYDSYNRMLTEEYSFVFNCVYNHDTGELSFERQVVDYTKIFEYSSFGQLTRMDFYDGAMAYDGQKDTTPRASERYYYEETAGSRIFGVLVQSRPNPREQIVYDYDTTTGQLIVEIRPNSGNGTYYAYNADGSLSAVLPASCKNALEWSGIFDAQRVSYTYYDSDLLKNIITESTTYTFTYDVFGNTTSVEAGEWELASYEYHPSNGKLQYLHYGNGTTIEYVYNELENVSEIWYILGDERTQAYTYKYNVYGQLYRFDNLLTGKTMLYSYDGNRRMIGYVELNTSDLSADFSASVEYNDKSQISTVSYFFDYSFSSANTVAASNLDYMYTYGDDGVVAELDIQAGNQTHSFTYGYNEYGWATQKIYNSNTGFKSTVEYDYYANVLEEYPWVEYYRSTVVNTNANTTSSYTSYYYEYDNLGNITEISFGVNKYYRYVYDNVGQLIREDNSLMNKTYVYEYDNAGNITRKYTYALTAEGVTPTALQSTRVYSYGDTNWGDKLTAYQGQTITYDAVGNPLSYYNGTSWTFAWFGGRRLTVASNDTYTLLFEYNDDGIRTSKTVNGVSHVYHLNGSQIVTEEWGGKLLVYLYDAAGSPIGMQYRSSSFAEGVFETYWFEKNLQGDIVAVYSSAGIKLISYVYDAWGNHTIEYHNGCNASSNANLNPFRYRGYYYDAELYMYYLQSRYYDPVIGRFISTDGVAYLGADGTLLGYNLFAYCGNNPVMGYDPEGTVNWKGFWCGVGITAIGAGIIVATVLTGGTALAVGAGIAAGVAVTGSGALITCGAATEEPIVFDISATNDATDVKTGYSFVLDFDSDSLIVDVYQHYGGTTGPTSVNYSAGRVYNYSGPGSYAGPFIDVSASKKFNFFDYGLDYCRTPTLDPNACYAVSGTVGISLPAIHPVTVGMDYYIQIACWELR